MKENIIITLNGIGCFVGVIGAIVFNEIGNIGMVVIGSMLAIYCLIVAAWTDITRRF